MGLLTGKKPELREYDLVDKAEIVTTKAKAAAKTQKAVEKQKQLKQK